MLFSVSEAAALLRKAAVGAGVSYGHADELASIVVMVPERDDAFWSDVVQALNAPLARVDPIEDEGVLIYREALTIFDGIGAIDAAICGQEVRVMNVDAPLVFELLVRRAEAQFEMALMSSRADGEFILRAGQLERAAASEDPQERIYLPDPVHAEFTALAARTHVPASSQSREAGAGAGLDDND